VVKADLPDLLVEERGIMHPAAETLNVPDPVMIVIIRARMVDIDQIPVRVVDTVQVVRETVLIVPDQGPAIAPIDPVPVVEIAPTDLVPVVEIAPTDPVPVVEIAPTDQEAKTADTVPEVKVVATRVADIVKAIRAVDIVPEAKVADIVLEDREEAHPTGVDSVLVVPEGPIAEVSGPVVTMPVVELPRSHCQILKNLPQRNSSRVRRA
jgi:hypothetical protein